MDTPNGLKQKCEVLKSNHYRNQYQKYPIHLHIIYFFIQTITKLSYPNKINVGVSRSSELAPTYFKSIIITNCSLKAIPFTTLGVMVHINSACPPTSPYQQPNSTSTHAFKLHLQIKYHHCLETTNLKISRHEIVLCYFGLTLFVIVS